MTGVPLEIPAGRCLGVQMIPLSRPVPLRTRVFGIDAAEARPFAVTSLPNLGGAAPTQGELVELERMLRDAALGGPRDQLLLGLDALAVVEQPSGGAIPVWPGMGVARAGTYQLMHFPIERLNGVALPPASRVRFADPFRAFSGGMETRVMSIFVEGTNRYYAWDAHLPVGNGQHSYWHINQKGMFNVFGDANHAALSGPALLQARQLRYLKIGGRVFLVAGVVVDGALMAGAAYESYQQGSPRPVMAQTVRTAGSWAAAWAGAKAGLAVGALAGVETGPGLVLTAIGGGIVGGAAGYLGADWIADFIYED